MSSKRELKPSSKDAAAPAPQTPRPPADAKLSPADLDTLAKFRADLGF